MAGCLIKRTPPLPKPALKRLFAGAFTGGLPGWPSLRIRMDLGRSLTNKDGKAKVAAVKKLVDHCVLVGRHDRGWASMQRGLVLRPVLLRR